MFCDWIEHLEHRGRRISARAAARHLVDLVDHQHGIFHRHAAQRLDDQARHRADIRATVSANLGLVAHAADRDAIELAADRLADRFAERRLAGARRSDEAENRAVRIAAAQLAHGEILDDALLRFVESVVPVVERRFDFLEIDLFFARLLVPRQRQHPVEIRAHDLVLARRRREHAHALGLAPRFLRDFLGKLCLFDLLEQIDRFLLARIRFAQLGLDRAQLLAEIELALVLLDLDLGLLLHVLHHARARDFALETREDEAKPLPDVEALEHLVLVGDPEIHVRRREVGEPARIGDVHLEDRRHFVRNAIHELGQRLRGRDDARHEVVDVRWIGGRFARRANRGDRIGLRLLHLVDRRCAAVPAA